MGEGIKYDTGKPRYAETLVDFKDAFDEVCKVWTFGANKYGKSNWKEVDDAETRYTNAMIRHLIAEDTNAYDNESKILHAAHVAWNALARLYFIKNKTKEAPKYEQLTIDFKDNQ